MSDYQRELAQLAAELLTDDATLTPGQATALGIELMEPLYTYALDYNTFATALRPIRAHAA